MADRQIGVNLAFTADTSAARKQLQALQVELQNIAKMPGRPESLIDDKPIKEASEAAMELQKHLSAAMNVNTGNLDLSRFSTSLKASGKTLEEYSNKLLAIGPEGQQAFLQLAQSIASAEIPTARLSKTMSDFLVTLKNTAKWQISSSLIHGFMGSLQHAYGYAQDLNQSLNNIRIVTGKSTDEMAAFAKEANEAAKALSTTTTDYTDASLIYYQQGLSDEEVQARTDVTIKMANAAGESAEKVSQQLTAVWNNFADGADNLEYYADVMTALGAATASSTDEIAEGLEKFASIADTVGLSYEYATSALATVTATTRQSADVVGNAFKTLFARIQGLQLGDTLDDGTDLNKYSQALYQVGINIKDTNGDMKSMDTILDELGQKWNTLGKDQQMALAQTVAGVRQYTQLIALMDNWDFFQSNLGVARNAEGILQEQADIYAESWEAAQKRVQAAAEGVYKAIINDEFFIDIINAFEKILEGVNGFVEGLGGMKGALTTIGGLFLSVYAKQIPIALDNLKSNLMVLTGQAKTLMLDIQATTEAEVTKIQNDTSKTQSEKLKAEGVQVLLGMNQKLIKVSSTLNEQERLNYKQRIDNVQAMYQEAEAIARETEEIQRQIEEYTQLATAKAQNQIRSTFQQYSETQDKISYLEDRSKAASGQERTAIEEALAKARVEAVELDAAINKINNDFNTIDADKISNFFSNPSAKNIDAILKDINIDIKQVVSQYEQLSIKGAKLESLQNALNSQLKIWKENPSNIESSKKALEGYLAQMEELGAVSTGLKSKIQDALNAATIDDFIAKYEIFLNSANHGGSALSRAINANIEDFENLKNQLQELNIGEDVIQSIIEKVNNLTDVEDRLAGSTANVRNEAQQIPEHNKSLTSSFANFASAVMMTWQAVQSLTNAFKIFTNESSTTSEKVGALINIFTSFAFAIGPVSKSLQELPIILTGIDAALKKASFSVIGFQISLGLLAIILAAVTAAITGAIIIYDKLHFSVKEANEAIKESEEVLSGAISEIQNLDNQLSDLNKQIDELLNKDKLTLTDKEDLARLKAQTAELKAQKILQQEIAKEAAQKTIASGEEAFSSKQNTYGNIDDLSYSRVMQVNYDSSAEIRQAIDNYIAEHNYSKEEFFASKDLISDFIATVQAQDDFSSNIGLLLNDVYVAQEERSNKLTEENAEAVKSYIQDVFKYGTDTQKQSSEFQSALSWMEEYYKEHNLWGDLLQSAAETVFGSNEEMQSALQNGLTKEQVSALDIFASTISADSKDIIADLKAYDVQLEETSDTIEDITEQVTSNLETLNSALSNLHTGKELSDDEISYLEELEGKYAELGEAFRTVGRESKEYISVLETVQEAEEQAYQEQLRTNLADSAANYESAKNREANDRSSRDHWVSVIPDMDQVNSAISEVFDKKYELEVSLTDDIITDVDSIVDDTENLAMAVSKIGQNFEVTAEDVEALFKVFPELAEDAKVGADGILQLDQEITESVLKNYGLQIDARKEKTVQEINNRIEELKLKKQALEEELEAIQNKELTAEELDELTTKYAIENIDEVATNNQNATDAAIQNSGILTQTIIDNWAKAAAAATTYGTIAAEAAFGQVKTSFVAEDATISAPTVSANITDPSKDEEETLKKRRAIVEEAMKKQVISYERQIADLTTSASKLLSSNSNIEKSAIDRLQADEDKKKSKSGSDKSEKEAKKLEDEFDRYWQIKKAIDAVDRAISKLDRDQENLYGYELINSLKQENQLLDQQRANYEALAAAQREEAAELQGVLSGYGVAFDASGAITNYAAATAAALAEYNAAIAQYNAGLIDASALSVYEKNYEAFKKALDRYETLYYQEMQDTQEKLEEIWRKELANNLKAWEVEVQLKLDMKELKRGWNDFINEIQDDFQKVYQDLRTDVKTLAEDAKTYLGNDGTIATVIGAIHDVTGEIDKLRSGGSSSMFESISQAQEKLKELNDTLQDSARAMHQLWQDAWDDYINGIDQVADQFDDLIDQFEKINDELEFQKEIIELLYGPEAFALMGQYYEGQEKNTLTQMESLKQQRDMWYDLWAASGATMDNQTDWTEDQRKYYEEWQEAQSDLNDIVLEYIRLLKDDYLNAVNEVLRQLEKSITGSSLSDLETEWERIADHADKYYDSVEGAYEIQSLANKIDQSIAATTNLRAQQKLQKLREREIEYLREKENLTEYDLQAAEARYQIALKEIALEDAQNNKTSMKLTRNEQGNWSYQYIADEDEVMSKRQELLDAYAELYQLASDAYEANLEALQDLQQKYFDSAREIYEDETLSEEERQAKLLELREWYLNEYALLAEENSLYRDDLALASAALLLEIYEQDRDAYAAMTDEEREMLDALVNAHIEDFMDLEDKIKDNYNEIGDKAREVMAETRQDWTSGAQQLADLWNKDNGASVKAQVVNAYDRISDANQRYQEKVDQCAAIVERDFSEEGIAGAIMRAEQETDNLKYKTEDMVASSVAYLNELKYYVDMIADAWKSVQQEILNAIALIEEYLRYVGQAQQAAAQQVAAANAAAQAAQPVSTGNTGDTKGSNLSPTTTPTANNRGYYAIQDQTTGVVLGTYTSKGAATRALNNAREHDDGYFTTPTSDTVSVVFKEGSTKLSPWSTSSGAKYATGGYTGEWDNGSTDGRLAWLHQKELVLNADDTKNFLSGINTIRDMSAANGSIGNAITGAVANMIAQLSGYRSAGSSYPGITNSSANTENNFNITAEFPNATNVDDIRQAILSLPNIASQYINNNNK